MTGLPQFPDQEAMLRAAITGGLGYTVTIVTRWDISLATEVQANPVVAITRTGGTSDRVTDTGRHALTVFAATAAAAKQTAEDIRDYLTGHPERPGIVTSAGLIDRVTTEIAPAVLAAGNDTAQVRAAPAAYRVSARRQPAA